VPPIVPPRLVQPPFLTSTPGLVTVVDDPV
jgi:hypothetical protein